jgi:hypothetical protein
MDVITEALIALQKVYEWNINAHNATDSERELAAIKVSLIEQELTTRFKAHSALVN